MNKVEATIRTFFGGFSVVIDTGEEAGYLLVSTVAGLLRQLVLAVENFTVGIVRAGYQFTFAVVEAARTNYDQKAPEFFPDFPVVLEEWDEEDDAIMGDEDDEDELAEDPEGS